MIHNSQKGRQLRKRLAAAGLSLALFFTGTSTDVMCVSATEQTAVQDAENPKETDTADTSETSETDETAETDSGQTTDETSETDSEQTTDKASETDSDQTTDEATETGSEQTTDEATETGSEQTTDEASETGSEQTYTEVPTETSDTPQADASKYTEAPATQIENIEDTDAIYDEALAGMADEETQRACVPKYLAEIEVLDFPEELKRKASLSYTQSTMNVENLPAQYDAREKNLITSVKNQNPYGTCWSHAITATLETAAVRQGLVADNNSIDLSERHLAYFTYNTGNDVLDNAADDTITQSEDGIYLDAGGNSYYATMRLMNWQGSAAEQSYPYHEADIAHKPIDISKAQDTSLLMKNCYFFPTTGGLAADSNDKDSARELVKSLIYRYGAVEWSYGHIDDYMNYSTGAYYNDSWGYTNHSITVVGWDDNYPKSRFLKSPSTDGAWIIKNSWSEDFGIQGYFYVSYDDVSMGSGNPAFVTEAAAVSDYDNNYFYGNTCSFSYLGGRQFASVFEAKGGGDREYVKAVSIMSYSGGDSYSLQLYKNPAKENDVIKDPTSGTPMLAEPLTGTIPQCGLHTIELPSPVAFEHGDEIVVCITFNDYGYIFVDKDSVLFEGRDYTVTNKNTVHPGQSFMKYSSWADLAGDSYSCNARINLLTVDSLDADSAPTLKTEIQDPSDFTKGAVVSLSWGKCANALSYDVYRSLNDATSFEKLTTTTENRYQDESLPIDTSKAYYKIMVHYIDKSVPSNVAEVVMEYTIQGPELKMTKSSDGATYQFDWTSINGADGYKLEYRILPESSSEETAKEADYQKLYTTTAASEQNYSVHADKLPAGMLEVRICAYKGTVCSQWSSLSFLNLGKAELTSVSADSSQQVTVNWTAMSGISGYKIYRYEVPADTKESQGATSTPMIPDVSKFILLATMEDASVASYADTTVKPGGRYFYSVSAYTKDQEGKTEGIRSEAIGIAVPAGKTQLLAKAEYDSQSKKYAVKLQFAKAEGAVSYQIMRGNDGVTYQSIQTIDFADEIDSPDDALITYEDKNTVIGKKYYYQVISYGYDLDGKTLKKGDSSNSVSLFLKTTEQEETTYSVTFDWQAEELDNLIIDGIEAGSNVEQPTAVARDGYTLAGWYKDALCTKEWNFSKDTINEDTILYAKWEISLDAGGLKADVISDYTYSGKQIKPTLKLYQNGVMLKAGKDYSVSYTNNVNVNTQKKQGYGFTTDAADSESFRFDLPTVTVVGKGNYQGTLYVNFNINALPLAQNNVLTKGVTLKYKENNVVNMAKSCSPLLFLKHGKKLKENTDYKLTISATDCSYDAKGRKLTSGHTLTGNTIEAGYTGTFLLTIEGMGNYSGTIQRDIHIASTDKLLNKAIITLGKECKKTDYTGKEITLTPAWYDAETKQYYEVQDGKISQNTVDRNAVYTVKAGKEYLIEGKDFETVYTNNTAAGNASLTIRGIGDYHGTKTIVFRINGYPMQKKNLTIEDLQSVVAYTGTAITQNNVKLTLSLPSGSRSLVYGKDYKLSYKNNVNAGKAVMNVIALPQSGITGTVSVPFTIASIDVNSSAVKASSNRYETEYRKTGAVISEQLQLEYNGCELLQGKDYTITYKNNKKVADRNSSKAPVALIRGKGNFKGTTEMKYSITKKDLNSPDVKVTINPIRYDSNNDSSYPIALRVSNGNAILKENRDYLLPKSEISNSVIKNYITLWKQCYEEGIVSPSEVERAKPQITLTGVETGNYTGTLNAEVPVYLGSIPSDHLYCVQESVNSTYEYTGSRICPKVEVYYCEDTAKLAEAISADIRDEDTLVQKYGMVKWLNGVHYELAYGTNTKIGNKKGSIDVVARSPLYTGKLRLTFNITQKHL